MKKGIMLALLLIGLCFIGTNAEALELTLPGNGWVRGQSMASPMNNYGAALDAYLEQAIETRAYENLMFRLFVEARYSASQGGPDWLNTNEVGVGAKFVLGALQFGVKEAQETWRGYGENTAVIGFITFSGSWDLKKK